MFKILCVSISSFLLLGCRGDAAPSEGSSQSTVAGGDTSDLETGSSVSSLSQDVFFTVTFLTGESGELVAFSEPIEAKISDDVEIANGDIPYEIDVHESDISIRWSELSQFDQYEGVIEEDENQRLVFEFTEPFFEARTPRVEELSNLLPTAIDIPSPAQLVVEFDAGTEVGDGFETTIMF